ncbi:MAG: 1,4-dihydroxy-6-naphthoate synthase [Bacteroidales bacterium]|jgi:1,4-dihydroxy-6-naphthoate synthase
MKLTLGFSPGPNDTFVFEALVHGRIDTEGIEFDFMLADIEELNRKALTGDLEITKMSCLAFAFSAGDYLILDSGSAMGHRNGPLLISKYKIDPSSLAKSRIAIPGKFTSANMLFSIAWPEAVDKAEYLSSDIESALLNEEVDAGLIINETRFTYFRKGLQKIADMGEYWEKMTGLPVPLGIIAINRKVPVDIALKVNRMIRKSLEYAYHDSMVSYDFVVANAKKMDRTVMSHLIKLFVNKYTLNLGKEGKDAISELFRISGKKGIIPGLPEQIFLTD